MKRTACLVGTIVALLGVQAASGDTIVYSDGSKVAGTLEEVVFLAGEAHGIYGRSAIASVKLSDDGKDVVVLRRVRRREGKLVSVRFRSGTGVITVPRKSIAAIELSPDGGSPDVKTTPEEAAPKDDPAAVELHARNKALARNLSLRNAFWDKPAELKKQEIRQVKQKYADNVRQVVKEIERLKDSVGRKERSRDDELRRWRARERRRKEEGSNRRRNPRPDFRNDGLDKDKKALRQVEKTALELKRTIRTEMKKTSYRASQRRKRVNAVYAMHKRALESGRKLTTKQVLASYQAALGKSDDEKTKVEKKRPEKKKDDDGKKQRRKTKKAN